MQNIYKSISFYGGIAFYTQINLKVIKNCSPRIWFMVWLDPIRRGKGLAQHDAS